MTYLCLATYMLTVFCNPDLYYGRPLGYRNCIGFCTVAAIILETVQATS